MPNETLDQATEQSFPVSEYARRVNLVRASMEAKGVDLLLIHTPENLNYISGYDTSGYFGYQFIALPLDGDPEILTRRLELENARRSTIRKHHVHFDLDDVVAKTVEIVRGFQNARRIGVEKNSWFLTARLCERLSSALAPNKLLDCSNLIDAIRVIKSPEELAVIRRAASIADTAISTAFAAIREGTSENLIAAAVAAATITAGTTYTGLPYLIKSGERCCIGHAQWEDRQLKRGDVVFMELSGCVKRYSAAIMRTCQVGVGEPAVHRAAEAVIAALNRMLAAMRPGAVTGDLYKVAMTEIENGGFAPSPRCMGYSMGIGYPPRWGEQHVLDFQPGGTTEIKPGMVFHVIPGILLSPSASIGFSETVLITDSGCECLTRSDRNFKILG